MEQQVRSVSELTRSIQFTLEKQFGSVAVTGELSNFKQHSSGHRYFSLKDAQAQISGVMWRSRTLSFTPADGMQVVARGKITVYPPRGNYQLDCASLQPLGKGDLQLAYEALKRKLYDEGLFGEQHKQPLPQFPFKIGVATSETGAAIRDILSALQRRMPACEVVLRPTLVQGEPASHDIVRALRELNSADCDLIIVGRGGGSLEDLWAFNTEEVARAIFASQKPVISAVGHEIDVTIADYVADVRAATPTAAAEIAVRDYRDVVSQLLGVGEHLQRSVRMYVQRYRERIRVLDRSSAFRRPIEFVRHKQQTLDELDTRLHVAAERAISVNKQRVSAIEAHFRSVHPFAPLARGFALLRKDDAFLASDAPLALNDTITLVRERDAYSAEIRSVEQHSPTKPLDR